MEYKTDLKKYLRTAKIGKQNFSYELSYEKVKDLNYLSREEILRYINDNYINDDQFKKKDLINDLIAFKTYRDYVEENVTKDDIFEKFLSVFISILSIFAAVKIGMLQIESQILSGKNGGDNSSIINTILEESIPLGMLVLGFIIIYFLIYLTRVGKRSEPSKLKIVNNVIYILEAIKEDMVPVPETKKFEVEVDNVVDQVSEPIKYSVNVNEILEDGINEGTNKDTIENKNKSIEIKINL